MALFRPRAGKEDDLMTCMREHLPLLRAQGFATEVAGDGILAAKRGVVLR
jgi:hypothetical protein